MDTGTLILILLIFGAAITALVWLIVNRHAPDGSAMVLLQNQMAELNRILDARMGQSNDTLQRQFSETQRIVTEVTEKLARLDETNKQVVGFTAQLQSLQDILKNPKQRGMLGEFYLETLLKNVLPPGTYEMQYRFPDRTAVDAVVRIKERIIPIDSKFSLENYNRLVEERNPEERSRLETALKNDLKTRIDETSKYIKPGQNTMDFAFMFIPSEAVYYDVLVNRIGGRDLIEYAFQKRVILVSPTSFFAYLQTVLQGLKALQVEEAAREIRVAVEKLGRHLNNYERLIKKLGANLSTTVKTFNESCAEFSRIDRKIVQITGVETENPVQPVTIDLPQITES
jgi:DNA recombination protein RmuC